MTIDKRNLSEDQVRSALGKVVGMFKSHGKTLKMADVLALADQRVEKEGPYLETCFSHFNQHDYKILAQVIRYEDAKSKDPSIDKVEEEEDVVEEPSEEEYEESLELDEESLDDEYLDEFDLDE